MTLIASARHRQDDLVLWADLEECDHLRYRHIGPRIERSLGTIAEFAGRGRFYIGVSWGKDSVVSAELALSIAPQSRLVNLRCTNRNPDCDSVRDAFLARWPTCAYDEFPVDYGDLHAQRLPELELDRLTDQRWYAAIAAAGRQHGIRHLLGIRADESGGRTIRCRRWSENSPNACAPLGWWTADDVFAYLARHELPVHPAYAMLGGGRWPRDRLRTAEIGDTHGRGGGRAEWEREYYGDVLNRGAVRR